MGRHYKYRAGSFYRNDDRSGFPTRAENTRKEWDETIVDSKLWEPRQPQDLVRGRKDVQSVPDARPLPPDQYVGPTSVQLTANANVGATALTVQTIAGFFSGCKVGVMLNSGVVFFTTLSITPSGSILTLTQVLPDSAAAGNLAFNYTTEISV